MAHFEQRPDHFAYDFAVFFQIDSRVNSREAAHARASEHSHQHGLGLIVEGVTGCDFVELGAVLSIGLDQLLEKSVAQFASGGFDAEALGSCFFLHIGAGCMEHELVLARKVRDEGFIFVGLGAAEFVIEMYDGEDDTQLRAKLQQKPKQRNGIRTSRDRDADSVPGLQQFKPPDVGKDFLREVMHRDMVQPGE